MNKETYNALSELKKSGVLYHGVSILHVQEIISQKAFRPYSSQRIWFDGRFLKDDHVEYDSSGRQYGWSMSRDINVAKNFGGVIFVFSRKKIQYNFKIKPISWNYFFSNRVADHKREKEDFVCSGGRIRSKDFYSEKTKQLESFIDAVDQLYYEKKITKQEHEQRITDLETKLDENNYFYLISKPHGKNLPLDNAIGFFILEIEKNDSIEKCIKLEKNPLFLGYI